MACLTSGPLAVDMYLRILLSVQQEVVDRDISQSPEVRLIVGPPDSLLAYILILGEQLDCCAK